MSTDVPPIETSDWNWPSGARPGCLPRRTAFGQCPGIPPLREAIEIIPEKDWPDLLGTLSLKPHVRVVLDQDGAGSCATESTTGAIMLCRSWEGCAYVLLNPWFIYHTTSGGRDAGSSIDENLAFVQKHGVAPESVWPRAKGWRANPTEAAWEAALSYRGIEAFDIETTAEFGTALLKGFPVIYGRAGHSILAVELKTTKLFDALGSWGTDGAGGTVNGYHLDERLAAVNWAYGAFALRSVTTT